MAKGLRIRNCRWEERKKVKSFRSCQALYNQTGLLACKAPLSMDFQSKIIGLPIIIEGIFNLELNPDLTIYEQMLYAIWTTKGNLQRWGDYFKYLHGFQCSMKVPLKKVAGRSNLRRCYDGSRELNGTLDLWLKNTAKLYSWKKAKGNRFSPLGLEKPIFWMLCPFWADLLAATALIWLSEGWVSDQNETA